jgi:amidophosphoribosyltransferase
MTDTLHEECGVLALARISGRSGNDRPDPPGASADDVVPLVPRALLDMQIRGQLSAGMTSWHPGRRELLKTHKGVGLVHEVFALYDAEKSRRILDSCAGTSAIAHVRYATCGREAESYAQPFERYHGRLRKWFTFCFNGQIANFSDLKDALARNGYHTVLDADTEVLLHLFSRALRDESRSELAGVFRKMSRWLDGSYNIAFLDATGRLAVGRDPHGFRPMNIGIQGRMFGAASESVALRNLGFEEIRPLAPGEVAIVEKANLRVERYAEPRPASRCFFEWVYFSSMGSNFDDKSVYLARMRLGEELAREETESIDDRCIVVPVPDTAKAAAVAMAHRLGIPSLEGVMRNRYTGRTFIEGEGRSEKVERKYTVIRDVIEGKRVFLVDDSLVRGNTLLALVRKLREVGAPSEIHVRIACPPIVAPCFYGIDMSRIEELMVPGYRRSRSRTGRSRKPGDEILGRIARDLGADSIRYVAPDALARCIDVPEGTLCRACVTGEYPTPAGEALHRIALERFREGTTGGRTYESRE